MFRIAFFLLLATPVFSQKWQPVEGHLLTDFARTVTPENAWQEYPRPQMIRDKWLNLNGLWQYAIVGKDAPKPAAWQGNILVPFPVESALSGVKKPLLPEQRLWYRTEFKVPKNWRGSEVLLNFEAVDFEAQVWVNGQLAGSHRGGYDPFSFQISRFLKKGKNELVVAVLDPSDTGTQAVGKQVMKPEGCFYTTSSGIWQTVWLEAVPTTHFSELKIISNLEKSQVEILPEILQTVGNEQVEAEAFFKNEKVATATGKAGEPLVLKIPGAKLWQPGQPNLYDLKLKILRDGQVMDEVSSYFGLRKIALGKDTDGFTKMLLNNKFVFQNGPLDQGFWPDGLHTPPSDEAMRWDLEMIQRMGFNMLRKHVKVEPRRFYYWCDRMGILVWQDMPSGDVKIAPGQADIVRSPESAQQFEAELKQLIVKHFNHPSIVVWVPFNEGWGQYETARISDFIKKLDPTRLLNAASGWNDRRTGDILDWHSYPAPNCPPAEEKRAVVVGEFGGLGLKTEGHMWETNNWGYANFNSPGALLAEYEAIYEQIFRDCLHHGLSAVVYTQITDVETETNGLLSYDRKVRKVAPEDLFRINTEQFLPGPTIEPPGGMVLTGDSIVLRTRSAAAVIRFTLDGSEPTENSTVFSKPFRLEKSAKLRARAFSKDKKSRVVDADFQITDLPKPRYLQAFSPKYRAGGVFALLDGVEGSSSFGDGRWQGFSGNDMAVVFDLKDSKSISSVHANFLESTDVWIFLPKKWSVFTSVDGVNFEKAGETAFEQPTAHRPSRIEKTSIGFSPRSARFVKIVAENVGVCPDWHPGKGSACWVFVDEVSVSNQD